jgi:hypothetical protein
MAAPEMQVKVSADTSQLESSLRSAERATAVFVAGIGAIAVGISAAVKSIVNMGDELASTTQKTGIAIKELQELAYVGKLSGVSAKQLEGAMESLNKGMSDLSKGGSSEAARALKAIGVEVKNFDGSLRNQSAVLADVAEKFSGYSDGVEKSELATKIFNSAGKDMIPMLNAGRDAMEESRKELQSFGALMSDQLTADSGRLTENLSKVGTFFTGLGVQIAERVVPALANASDAIVTWMRESGIAQSVGNALGAMFQNLESIVVVTGAALAIAFGPALIASIAAVTKAIAVGLVGALALVASLVVANPITALFAAGVAAALYFSDNVIGSIKYVGNLLINVFSAAAIDLEVTFKNAGNIIGSALIGIVNSFLQMVNSMVLGVKSALNLLIVAMNKIKIPGVKLELFDTSVGAVTEIADIYAANMSEAMKDRTRRIGEVMGRDTIGGFVTGIKNFAARAQNALGGAIKPPPPNVPGAAGGGDGSEEDENKKLRERLERRLEVVRQSVLSEEQLMIHKYQKAQELALKAFELDMEIYAGNEEIKLQKTQEYHALREALEQRHLQNLDKLRADSNAKSLNNLASFFSGAQALAQSNGNKSFRTAKAFAIAQAVLSTTAAAIQAMADPTAITPFQKFANYAAVLGKGLSAVASIKGMSPSGGGGGGGGGAGAGAAAGGGAAAAGGGGTAGRGPGGNSVYINLQGQSFGRDQVRDLVKQIADFQKDGGQVVFA